MSLGRGRHPHGTGLGWTLMKTIFEELEIGMRQWGMFKLVGFGIRNVDPPLSLWWSESEAWRLIKTTITSI